MDNNNPVETSAMDTTSDVDMDNLNEDDGNIKIPTFAQKKMIAKKFGKLIQNIKDIDFNEDDIIEQLDKMAENTNIQNDYLKENGVNEMMIHDAQCMAVSSQMAYTLVKKYNPESKFNRREFLRLLRQRLLINSKKAGIAIPLGKNPIRFEHLFPTGLALNRIHHHVLPMVRSFIPPENCPEKKVRVVRKKVKPPATLATQPTKYDASNMANEEDESEKRLRHIHTKLYKLQRHNPNGVPLMQSAIDPESFAITTENFFNIAFLARQKKIQIDLPAPDDDDDTDDSPDPIVKIFKDGTLTQDSAASTQGPVPSQEQPEEEEDINRPAVQSILTFDFDTYEALISNLDISRSAFWSEPFQRKVLFLIIFFSI